MKDKDDHVKNINLHQRHIRVMDFQVVSDRVGGELWHLVLAV